jgi:CHAT domain-containing protein
MKVPLRQELIRSLFSLQRPATRLETRRFSVIDARRGCEPGSRKRGPDSWPPLVAKIVGIHVVLRVVVFMFVLTPMASALGQGPPRSQTPARALTADQRQRLAVSNEQTKTALDAANKSRDFASAIPAVQATLEARRQVYGGDHDEVAQALDTLAQLYGLSGNPAAQSDARRQIVEMMSRLHGDGNWRTVDARLKASDQERIAAMTPEMKRRLDQASRDFLQATAKRNAKSYEEALAFYAKANAGFQECLGRFHRDSATCLFNLGVVHAERRESSEAARCMEEAIAIRGQTLGERHPEYIDSLTALATLSEGQGDFVRATRLFDRALTLHKAVVDGENPERAALLENLGRMLQAQGDHAGARPCFEQAVAINERIAKLGLESFGMSGFGRRRRAEPMGVGMLGSSARPATSRDRPSRFRMGGIEPFARHRGNGLTGMIGMARGLDTGDMLAMNSFPTHPWSLRTRARHMYQLATRDLREESAVSHALLQALESEQVRGDRWIAYARSLAKLADAYRAQGDVPLARLTRLRSLTIGLEASDPTENTRAEFSEFVDDFTALLQEFGELPVCQTLALNVVQYRRDSPAGEWHVSFAAALERLAGVLWARGDRLQAMLLYERAMEIRRVTLGEGHPDLAETLQRLALLHADRGDRDEAQRHARLALDLHESFVLSTLPFLPERQRLALLNRTALSLSVFLDQADGPNRADEVYRHLVAWKGIATEAAAAQRAAALSPELRSLTEELSRERDELNRLYYAIVPDAQAAQHARQIREKANRRSDLEARLADAVHWKPLAPTPEKISASLPEGAVLIDVFRYMRYVPASNEEIEARNKPPFLTHYSLPAGEGPTLRFRAHYATFVVRADQVHPTRVELGPAEPIDQAVTTWLDRIENGGDFDTPGRQVAQLVWSPMVAHLDGSKRVLISSDGMLNFLPWVALPGKNPDTFLVEDFSIGSVSSARQLVASAAPQKSAGGNLLVVGGVDYGRAESQASKVTPTETDVAVAVAVRSAPVAEGRINAPDLKETKAEADQVAELFRRLGPGTDGGAVVGLSGPSATKQRVREAMAQKRFLHLATHGYFAPAQVASALLPHDLESPLRSYEGLNRKDVSGLYPGLLSGLVFAGANEPSRDPATGVVDLGSGVMTAEEVAGLDLADCNMVVLSACETGLGRIADGEGVLGLQRSFHQAGARTVVASLWKVDDMETRRLMGRFYENLWRRRLGPLEALRQAQLEVLRQAGGKGALRGMSHPRGLGRPVRSDPKAERFTAHPWIWAGWVLSGEPGSSQGLPEPLSPNEESHSPSIANIGGPTVPTPKPAFPITVSRREPTAMPEHRARSASSATVVAIMAGAATAALVLISVVFRYLRRRN